MVIGLIDVWGMLQPVLTVGGFLMVAVSVFAAGVELAGYWQRWVRDREEQERREREEQEQRNR